MIANFGLILLGIVAGVMGGLFGIGGGLVMVPALTFFFAMDEKKAVGTSFATILLPVGVFGVIEYWRNGNVDVPAAIFMGIGFIGGAFLGAALANQTYITKNQFKVMYAVFLMIVAAKYLWDVFGAKPTAKVASPPTVSPRSQ